MWKWQQQSAHNTVFGSKCSAIFVTVERSYNVLFKLNDSHISTSVPATWKRCRYAVPGRIVGKKALVVANVIANEPITHNATAFHDPVSRYFIEWHIFPCPNDVIRPRPLRPSAWCSMPWRPVRRLKKLLGRVSCTESTVQGNEF